MTTGWKIAIVAAIVLACVAVGHGCLCVAGNGC